jgi:Xaa-Pro aminopeptidase
LNRINLPPAELIDTDLSSYVADELQGLRESPQKLAFATDEYARRLALARRLMEREGLDALVVSSPDGMCWLHGYQSRWYLGHSPTSWPPLVCSVIRTDSDEIIHFDDEHHRELIRITSVADRLCLWDDRQEVDGFRFILRALRAEGLVDGRIGQEMWSHVPNRVVSERLSHALEASGFTVSDASLLLREARRVKSEPEIKMIEEAARVCDAGLLALRDALVPGMTEQEAWAVMVSGMSALGGEPAAIHESVVVGPIQLGHAFSSNRQIEEGDCVCADPCGVVRRYHANIERFFAIGEPPSELAKIAQIEAGAFDVLCQVAKSGTLVKEVNRALREYLRESGVWGIQSWNGGYELGLSFPPDWVGEWYFSIDEVEPEGVIEAGMVSNYESIILYPMIDTIVYGAEGARTLSKVPLDILVVDA